MIIYKENGSLGKIVEFLGFKVLQQEAAQDCDFNLFYGKFMIAHLL